MSPDNENPMQDSSTNAGLDQTNSPGGDTILECDPVDVREKEKRRLGGICDEVAKCVRLCTDPRAIDHPNTAASKEDSEGPTPIITSKRRKKPPPPQMMYVPL
jgi:hypothetical protein